jgi:hypothetical protein
VSSYRPRVRPRGKTAGNPHAEPLKQAVAPAEAGGVTTLQPATGTRTPRAAAVLRATGDRRVLRVLRGLGPRWTVVPSVPVQGCPRALLAVGPGGVVLVEPRWYVGRKVWVGAGLVIVDGVKSDDVAGSRTHARTAAGLLTRAAGREVGVLGALAVLSEQRTVRSQPLEGDVLVHGPKELGEALAALPPVLSAAEVGELGALGDDLATWYPLGTSRPAARPPIQQG